VASHLQGGALVVVSACCRWTYSLDKTNNRDSDRDEKSLGLPRWFLGPAGSARRSYSVDGKFFLFTNMILDLARNTAGAGLCDYPAGVAR